MYPTEFCTCVGHQAKPPPSRIWASGSRQPGSYRRCVNHWGLRRACKAYEGELYKYQGRQMTDLYSFLFQVSLCSSSVYLIPMSRVIVIFLTLCRWPPLMTYWLQRDSWGKGSIQSTLPLQLFSLQFFVSDCLLRRLCSKDEHLCVIALASMYEWESESRDLLRQQ